jgi:hypothetical protein
MAISATINQASTGFSGGPFYGKLAWAASPGDGLNSNLVLYANQDARRAGKQPVFALSAIQIPVSYQAPDGQTISNPEFVFLRGLTMDQITAYLYSKYTADPDMVSAVPIIDAGQTEPTVPTYTPPSQ